MWEGLPEALFIAGVCGAIGYAIAPYDSRAGGSRRNATIVGAAFGLLGGLLDSLRERTP